MQTIPVEIWCMIVDRMHGPTGGQRTVVAFSRGCRATRRYVHIYIRTHPALKHIARCMQKTLMHHRAGLWSHVDAHRKQKRALDDTIRWARTDDAPVDVVRKLGWLFRTRHTCTTDGGSTIAPMDHVHVVSGKSRALAVHDGDDHIDCRVLVHKGEEMTASRVICDGSSSRCMSAMPSYDWPRHKRFFSCTVDRSNVRGRARLWLDWSRGGIADCCPAQLWGPNHGSSVYYVSELRVPDGAPSESIRSFCKYINVFSLYDFALDDSIATRRKRRSYISLCRLLRLNRMLDPSRRPSWPLPSPRETIVYIPRSSERDAKSYRFCFYSVDGDHDPPTCIRVVRATPVSQTDAGESTVAIVVHSMIVLSVVVGGIFALCAGWLQ